MKTLAIITLGVVTALTLLTIFSTPDTQVEVQFQKFLDTYRVGYAATNEYSFRLGVFESNLKTIAELSKANPKATFAVNQFADRTPEEMKRMMGLTGGEAAVEAALVSTAVGDAKSVDWSDMWSEVKNQGSCGSCWAFSAVGALEARWARHEGDKKVKVSFAPQQFVDCDTNCYGCNGGLMDYAFTYASTHKLCTDKEYTYKAKDETCHDQDCTGPTTNPDHPFTDLDKNADAIVSELWNGPLSVAVDASTWSFYAGGVLSTKCSNRLNHGVTLVSANLEAETPYVTIRNSWGQGWGEKGLIRLSIADNSCCWLNDASIPNF